MSAKAEKRQVSVQDRRDFDGRRSTTASVATASSRKITTTGRRRSQSANRKGAVLEQKLPSEKTGLEQKFHIREEGRETAGRIVTPPGATKLHIFAPVAALSAGAVPGGVAAAGGYR